VWTVESCMEGRQLYGGVDSCIVWTVVRSMVAVWMVESCMEGGQLYGGDEQL
jgi:hypothetical protein